MKLTPGGAPSVNIEWFVASNHERSKGRATLFLKKIVEELQKEKTPHARIELYAWTGYNSEYGRTNGAYTWARLGFQVKESTKKERLADCDDSKHIDYMKKKIQKFLKNDRCDVHNYLLFTKLKKRPRLEFEEVNYIIEQTIKKVKRLETPWDIANLTVEGYPIGKLLMSSLDESRFNGVLYPNLVHSPGMIQYTKRMEELRKAGHLL